MEVVAHESAGRAGIEARDHRRPLERGLAVGGESGHRLHCTNDARHRVRVPARNEDRKRREQVRTALLDQPVQPARCGVGLDRPA